MDNDDILNFFFGTGSAKKTPYDDAWFWFNMSPAQKRQHVYVDSDITARQLDLILQCYGEDESVLEDLPGSYV